MQSWMTLPEDFANGQDHFPRNRQQALHLLDKFTKTLKPKENISEGSSFATVGKLKKSSNEYKLFWKDKTCYTCGKKGHPSSEHTP